MSAFQPLALRARVSVVVGVLLATILASSRAPTFAGDPPSMKASTLSFRVKDRKISDVLTFVEKKTKNRVRLVDDFGRDDHALLDSKITLAAKDEPFWKVIDAIAKQTETIVLRTENGTLQLGKPTDFNATGRHPEIGASRILESVRLTPALDRFFHHVVIKVETEPRLGRFEPGETTLKVARKGGEPLELEQHSFSGQNGITRFLELKFELKEKRKKIPAEELESLTLSGHFSRVSYEKKRLGSLEKLLAAEDPVEAGLVKIRVKSIETKREDSEEKLVVQLELEGPYVTQANFELLVSEKKSVAIHGGSASLNEGLRAATLEFPTAELGKSPRSVVLVVNTPIESTPAPIDVQFTSLHAPEK